MFERNRKTDSEIYRLSERVIRRYFRSGFGNLSAQDQVFFCVNEVEIQVKNGGLYQLMANTPVEVLRHVPSALRKIGAIKTAVIVERAFLELLGSAPSDSQTAHEAVLNALDDNDIGRLSGLDSEFYETGEELFSLLVTSMRSGNSHESAV